MANTRVAYRYAKSLLALSLEKEQVDIMQKDMQLVSTVCNENKELMNCLKSPIIKVDKKLAILTDVFKKNVCEISWAFINIITLKKRGLLLGDISTSFLSLVKEHKNIVTAEIKSTIKLDDDLKMKILGIIQKTDAQIDLIETIDPKLIGGFILRVGDKQIDSSVQRKINDLKQEFSKNAYIKEV